MISKPKIEVRKEQHTLGIRASVPLRELPRIIPAYHKEVFAFLKKQGVTPAGPPFLRYHVINMKGKLEVEVASRSHPRNPATPASYRASSQQVAMPV
jgi:hypothetical protein